MQGNRTPPRTQRTLAKCVPPNPAPAGHGLLEAPIYRAGPARAASVVAVQPGKHEPLPQNA